MYVIHLFLSAYTNGSISEYFLLSNISFLYQRPGRHSPDIIINMQYLMANRKGLNTYNINNYFIIAKAWNPFVISKSAQNNVLVYVVDKTKLHRL